VRICAILVLTLELIGGRRDECTVIVSSGARVAFGRDGAGVVLLGLIASPGRPGRAGGIDGGSSLLTSPERGAAQDLVDLQQRGPGVGVDTGRRTHRVGSGTAG
jgi:hypothetical protein